MKRTKWLYALAGTTASLLAGPATTAAQCIMCYLSASSSGERGSQVLRMGILVLVIPTLLTFAGLFLLAYRRRNPAGWDEDSQAAMDADKEPFLPLPTDQEGPSPSVF